MASKQNRVKVVENKGYLTLQLPAQYSRLYYNVKQKYIAFGGEATNENYALAYQAAAELQKDLEEDTFNPNDVQKYKHPTKRRKRGYELKSESLIELYDKWVDKTRREGKRVGSNRILSKSGERQYRGQYRRYILSLPQSYLTKEDQEEIAEYLEKNVEVSGQIRVLQILANMMDWALENSLLPKNTSNKFKELADQVGEPNKRGTPKVLKGLETFRDPEKKAWTKEERDLIIEAIQSRPKRRPYYKECDVPGLLIEFLFQTGMRHGEAFALRWDKIRITERGVQCVIDLSWSSKWKHTKETKTGKSRTIWLNDKASEIIKTLKEFYESLGRRCVGDSLVFQKESGSRFQCMDITYVWLMHTSYKRLKGVGKLVKEGKLPQYLDAYSTRRTFCSLQAQAGQDAKTVADYIGDNVETVYEHYYQAKRVEGGIPAQNI